MAQVINKHSQQKNHNKKPKNQESRDVFKVDLKGHSVQQLYSIASEAYQRHKNTKNQSRWNQIFAKAGTKKDKIAAISSMIIESPQSCLQHLDLLVKWCFDDNASFSLTACQALTDIYTEHVFLEKSSLKIFVDLVQQHIKSHKKNSFVSEAELIGFYLEHKLKHSYSEFIRSLEMLLQRNINYAKKGAINVLVRLTRHNELRRNIIAIIINKFGQSDKQIVNEVSKSLKNEFYQDLISSVALLEEVEVFLARKNLAINTQFYVINFLNSLNLKFLNENGMQRLFQIFYYFFNKMIDADNDESYSSRLFLNSVKGLNKIMSYIRGGNKATRDMIEQKTESVYRIAHSSTNTKAKVQLLLFLFQSHSHLSGNLPDRYYRVLYDFIGNEGILSCSLTEIFFDLLLVSIKQDQNLVRVTAFLKRLLQLCFQAPSNFVVTCLIMVSKVIEQKQSLRIAFAHSQNWLSQKLQELQGQFQVHPQMEKYDMFKREPLYCGAQKTCLWEIRALLNHYHPTVRKYAQNIVDGQKIDYDGHNPLLEYSLTSFIEKFSLRKEKKSEGWKIKMKKNLLKIRSSKYQSMIQKPLSSFREDQEFIKRYLQKRQKIHNNVKKRHLTDIDEFADNLIERQMDKLDPANQDLDDLSLSPQSNLSSQQEQEDLEEFQDQQQQFGEDQQGHVDGPNSQENLDQGDLDQSIDAQHFEAGSEESHQQQSEIQSADRQFEDAFDDIGQSDQYPRKHKKIDKLRNKPSKRGNKKFINKNGRANIRGKNKRK